MSHQHEKWMIRSNGDGGWFCGACGDRVTDPKVTELYERIKDIEEGDGNWNGGDVIQVLSLWFEENGIDINTDSEENEDE